MSREKKSALVYSSERGRVCPKCGWPEKGCVCSQRGKAVSSVTDGIVRVGRQTKGRKGSGVTVVSGLPLAPDQLVALAKELKKKCGAGGTTRDGVIEIQGEHRDFLIAELSTRGFQVKRSGG